MEFQERQEAIALQEKTCLRAHHVIIYIFLYNNLTSFSHIQFPLQHIEVFPVKLVSPKCSRCSRCNIVVRGEVAEQDHVRSEPHSWLRSETPHRYRTLLSCQSSPGYLHSNATMKTTIGVAALGLEEEDAVLTPLSTTPQHTPPTRQKTKRRRQ
ncbi:hypothetical protein KC19_11G088500 [Ceratodon purpureus]|uniref:Uncharacterized protein n=1 Tax=Ceratodon purpureus TaxID=3225 RepID=A0A8T0GCY3_CERPU|nr:hypothetical protein KC19_11G088500 [Ceratodon purpureus]